MSLWPNQFETLSVLFPKTNKQKKRQKNPCVPAVGELRLARQTSCLLCILNVSQTTSVALPLCANSSAIHLGF